MARKKKQVVTTQDEVQLAQQEELVRHPAIPTWPTPAAKAFTDEMYRLQEVAKVQKYDLKTFSAYQGVITRINEEHTRWQEDVVKAARHHHVEDPVAPSDFVPYGSPVERPSAPRPLWHLVITFLLGFLTAWFIYVVLS